MLGAIETLHAGRTSTVFELRSHPLYKTHDTATGGRRDTGVISSDSPYTL